MNKNLILNQLNSQLISSKNSHEMIQLKLFGDEKSKIDDDHNLHQDTTTTSKQIKILQPASSPAPSTGEAKDPEKQ